MKRIGIVAGFLILFVGVIVTLATQFGKQADQMAGYSASPTPMIRLDNNTGEAPQVKGAQDTQQIPQNEDMKQPKMSIDVTKKYTAVMKTSAGDIELELYADKTPITVNNFITLANKKFYDNVIFHRIIKGFMIQGGDPTGTGAGGPGYQFNDEPFTGEYLRGTLAMANAGPNTNGSQFFIMHADYPLPPNYVIFGKVIKGLDVVDKIAEAPVTMSASGENSQPVSPVKILSVDIVEK